MLTHGLMASSLRTIACLPVLALALAGFVACSGEDGSNGAPAGADSGQDDGREDGGEPRPSTGDDAGSEADGAPVDPTLPLADEQEPNDGKTPTEVGAMALPSVMKGAISPANDQDLFAIAPQPGELWEWSLAPTTPDLAPHLVIFDSAADNKNPTVLAAGAAGKGALTLEHFVLNAGQQVAVVRDTRNVPKPTGVGGTSYGYTLTARRKTAQPVAVTFPSTKTGTLASLSSIALYAFSTTSTATFAIVVRAARKAPSSTLDSRLSLYDVNGKRSVLTNDDLSAAVTDSELRGTLPAGSYLVLLENEGTNATDLSYEIEFATK